MMLQKNALLIIFCFSLNLKLYYCIGFGVHQFQIARNFSFPAFSAPLATTYLFPGFIQKRKEL